MATSRSVLKTRIERETDKLCRFKSHVTFLAVIPLLGAFILASSTYLLWGSLTAVIRHRHVLHGQDDTKISPQGRQDPSQTASATANRNATLFVRNTTARNTDSVSKPSQQSAQRSVEENSGVGVSLDQIQTNTKDTSPDDHSDSTKAGLTAPRVAAVIRNSLPSSANTFSPFSNSSTLNEISTRDQQSPKLLCTHFTGRLGNQLFEYASTLGLALSQNRIPVFLDSKHLVKVLRNFTVSPANTNTAELEARCKRAKHKSEDKCCTFKKELTELDPRYDYKIAVYLQSYKYFENHEAEIRKAITFNDGIQSRTNAIVKQLRQRFNNSVLVGAHVRRGDMASPHNQRLGYPLVSLDFMNRALAFFAELFPECVFVVASEKPQWCKDNFPKRYTDRLHFLEDNEPAVDMSVLAAMDHVITSFGTFSWWIGYQNRGKVVYMKDFIRANTVIGSCFLPQGKGYVYPRWIPL